MLLGDGVRGGRGMTRVVGGAHLSESNSPDGCTDGGGRSVGFSVAGSAPVASRANASMSNGGRIVGRPSSSPPAILGGGTLRFGGDSFLTILQFVSDRARQRKAMDRRRDTFRIRSKLADERSRPIEGGYGA
jgi:hypothetical protein